MTINAIPDRKNRTTSRGIDWAAEGYVVNGSGGPAQRMIRFRFHESKTLGAVLFIAQCWPGISPFYLAKTLFFADRDHLRAYGRPATGEAYIAMADSPVPARIYEMVKDNLDFFGNPQAIVQAIQINHNDRYRRINACRGPDPDQFSETDIAALEAAIALCRDKSFSYLSELTHQERGGWVEAPPNGVMDLELLVPEERREDVREAAAYAVL